jgi:outer membrane protein assembly factor BamB
MKRLTNKIILILLLIALGLSACTGSAATAASSWPGVTADADTAYLAFNQHVYAISLSNGSEKWRFPADANNKITFYADPVLTPDGQLLVGGYDFVLYSLNPQTGTMNWSSKEAKNRYIGSPLAVDSAIFAPAADDHLYAFDLQGRLLWSFQTKGAQWAQPVTDPACGCVYLATMDHHIYAIDAKSGSEKWQTDDLGGSMVGTPAYSPDSVLYIGTFGSEMLAINAGTKVVEWRTPTTGWVWGGPVLKDGKLYFGDLKGWFYAIDATNGSIDWKQNPDGPVTQPPLVTADRIYFTTQSGTIYSYDFQGKEQWNKLIGGKLYASPVLAGDKILVAPTGMDSYLIALAMDGTQVWQFIPAKK